MTSPSMNSETSKSTCRQRWRNKSEKNYVKSATNSPESERIKSNVASPRGNTFQTTSSILEHDGRCSFFPSVLVLISFALFMHVASMWTELSPFIAGVVILALTAILREWVDLYAPHLSRAERVKFDFTNILANSQTFNFNHTVLDDPSDPPTPGTFYSLIPFENRDAPTRWPSVAKYE